MKRPKNKIADALEYVRDLAEDHVLAQVDELKDAVSGTLDPPPGVRFAARREQRKKPTAKK